MIPEKPTTIAVKLKPSAERHVKKGHPWIFEDSIIKESKEPKTGDIAIIFDNQKNNYLAIGLYDMDSPIKIKIIKAHERVKLNDEWIAKQLKISFNLRQPLLAKNINSYRLINGENDCFPSLIVDIYDQVAVIKIYSLIWMRYLETITSNIIRITEATQVVLRSSRNIMSDLESKHQLTDGMVIHGTLDDPNVVFTEYGVKFIANVIDGHKTGYFLDHRYNRNKVGLLSKGKKVLDVFSYAGGFSVHALVNGAAEVTSVDISKQALELASENAKLNKVKGKHKTISGDAFEVMENLYKKGEKFDIIIVDPPSFAKKATEVPGALSSYEKLAKAAIKLVENNGLLIMASCSARVKAQEFFETIEAIFEQSKFTISPQEKTYHDVDHPINFPEGAYLKCGYYRVTN